MSYDPAQIFRSPTMNGHGLDDDVIAQAQADFAEVQKRRAKGLPDYAEPGETASEPELPEVMSAGAMLDADLPLKEVIVEGWFRRQEVGTLVGGTKSRKSFLLMLILLSIATGRALFGMFPVTRGRCLLIDNEIDKSVLKARLKAVAAAMGILREQYELMIDIVSLRGRVSTMNDVGRIMRRAGAGVYAAVGIDAMYRLYPEDFDENSNADMTRLLTGLVGDAKDSDAAVIVVHHLSKGSQAGKGISDLGAGAGSLSRLVDFHIAMRPLEEPNCAVLDGVVRSFPEFERLGIAWGYPEWRHDPDLDVSKLAGQGGRPPKVKVEPPPKPPAMTPPEFAAKFIGIDPRKADVIKATALASGMKISEIKTLIVLAESERLIHRWTIPGSNAAYYANREPELVDVSVSLSRKPLNNPEGGQATSGEGAASKRKTRRRGKGK